jgi:hypothetical protein
MLRMYNSRQEALVGGLNQEIEDRHRTRHS